MAEPYRYTRGDRYVLSLPCTKDGVAFDFTSGGPWTVTACLGQGDTKVAITEAEQVGVRCTLTVTAAATGIVSCTICESAKLAVGYYALEIRAVSTGATYTWPTWTIWVTEPLGV